MAKSKSAKIDTGSYKYGRLVVRGHDGKLHYSSGNGDAVQKAMLLHVAAGGTMKQVIEANKLDTDPKNTNVGLVRMAVGVALRGKVRNGQTVKIGKLAVKSLKQKIALPKVEAKAPGARAKGKKTAKPARRVRRRSVPKPAETPAPAEQAAA